MHHECDFENPIRYIWEKEIGKNGTHTSTEVRHDSNGNCPQFSCPANRGPVMQQFLYFYGKQSEGKSHQYRRSLFRH
jgi:hypothetical protein